MASDPVEEEQSSQSTAGKGVRDKMKAVLEVILVLLKVLRELFGLFRDKNDPHRPDANR